MTNTQSTAAAPSGPEVVAKDNVQRFYRPELDAIRFVLFLAVFAFHALSLNGRGAFQSSNVLRVLRLDLLRTGGFSLSLFFFLSAYLIMSLLRIERRRTGTIRLRSFYIRRMLRIWPLYVGYIALICFFQHVSPAFHLTRAEVLAMLFFVGNWYFSWHNYPTYIVAHLWSISVEEQFYLVFSAVARLCSDRFIRVLCWALGIASVAVTYFLAKHGERADHLWTNSFVEGIFFCGGTLYAMYGSLEGQQKSSGKASLGISAGLTLWFISQAFGILPGDAHPTPEAAALGYLLVAIADALLLWGTLRAPKVLQQPSLVFLGKISFGLYIFHIPVIYLTRIYIAPHEQIPGLAPGLALLLTVGLATLSFRFFEQPILRFKRYFEVVSSRETATPRPLSSAQPHTLSTLRIPGLRSR